MVALSLEGNLSLALYKQNKHNFIFNIVHRIVQEDPTVDMANDMGTSKRENNSEVMSGMVRTTHRESGHLVFTPSGDVMLPPRAAGANPVVLNSTLEPVRNEINPDNLLDPPRRGRGRPRKTPLPLTPKIKKKRGRPPKTSLGKYILTTLLEARELGGIV